MSKFKKTILIFFLALIMVLLQRYAQLYFEQQDVKITIGIGYVVLFSSALILTLPSAMIMITIAVVGANFPDVINGFVLSTLLVDFVMLLVFEWWINYTRRMPFSLRYFPGVMLSSIISVYLFFLIDIIFSGFPFAVICLGYRSIEALICVLISLPILYLISVQNIGVRKYSPRYKLK